METIDLQITIKSLIKKINWSQKKLARELYMDKYDFEDEVEMVRFEEKVKKSLTRKTTDKVLLKGYIEFIKQHNEFGKVALVAPTYVQAKNTSPEFNKVLFELSKTVDEKLLSEDTV